MKPGILCKSYPPPPPHPRHHRLEETGPVRPAPFCRSSCPASARPGLDSAASAMWVCHFVERGAFLRGRKCGGTLRQIITSWNTFACYSESIVGIYHCKCSWTPDVIPNAPRDWRVRRNCRFQELRLRELCFWRGSICEVQSTAQGQRFGAERPNLISKKPNKPKPKP